MAGYIGTQPVPQATQSRDSFTATANQTTFATAGYQPGYIDVYLNGVHLVDVTDYTATNGSDVVLASGASVNDIVEVVAYSTFEVLNQTLTGTTTVDVLNVTGAFTSLGIDDNATSTAMTLSSGGNVGIGATATGTKLDVLATVSDNFVARFENNHATGSYGIAVKAGDDSGNYTADFANKSGTSLMRIRGDGNVGIGTSSPSLTLHVNSTTSGLPVTSGTTQTNGVFRLSSNATSGIIDFGMNGTNPWIQSTGSDGLGATYNLLLNPNGGNVGIGTSSPAAKLHATGTFGTTLTSGIRLDGLGTTTNNLAPIAFYTQSSNWGTQHAANIAAAQADGADGGAYLRFSTSPDGNTAPTERMRINSSGNLLVGKIDTSSNTAGTTIWKDGYLNSTVALPTANTSYVARFNRKTTDGPILELQKDGTSVGSISSNSSSYIAIGSDDTGILFYDGGDAVTPFNTTTQANAGGALDLGHNAIRWRDLYLSGGVNFGSAGGTGTSTSNLLDDYEEGSGLFSTITDSAGTALGVNTNYYTYTKIGNLVTLELRVVLGAATAAEVKLTGLPFVGFRTDTEMGVVIGRNAFLAGVNNITLRAGTNNAYMFGVVHYFTAT